MSLNPLEQNQPFDMAMMNPNPSSSKTKEGPVYRVSFEVDKETWSWFMDADTKGLILGCRCIVTQDGQLPLESKQEKGPYGNYWRHVFAGTSIQDQQVFLSDYVGILELLGTDEHFLDWLRQQDCAIHSEDCQGQTVPAHVRRVGKGAGVGIKPAFSAIPLCQYHHEQQHQKGEPRTALVETFEVIQVVRLEPHPREHHDHAECTQ